MFYHERGRATLFGKLRGFLTRGTHVLGPFHPTFCQVCGKCYYRSGCIIGDPNLVKLGVGFRDAFRMILNGKVKA